jgi:hypothetical protein
LFTLNLLTIILHLLKLQAVLHSYSSFLFTGILFANGRRAHFSFVFFPFADGASARSSDLQGTDDEKSLKEVLNMPWFSNLSHNITSVNRKEVSRERKQKWIFKSTQGNRFSRLITMCGQKLGTETTVQVFGKLGRETGLKEYNALIGLYIQRARTSNDEDIALEQIHKAFRIFESMREQGFQLEEETYGPFLMYLIDMGMVEEFHFFCEVIRKENTRSLSRLGYYEMLLWLGVNNEEKIRELCNYIAVDDRGDKSHLRGIWSKLATL